MTRALAITLTRWLTAAVVVLAAVTSRTPLLHAAAGQAAVPVLTSALKSDDAEVRHRASKALDAIAGKITSATSAEIAQFIDTALDDDPVVRAPAIKALTELGASAEAALNSRLSRMKPAARSRPTGHTHRRARRRRAARVRVRRSASGRPIRCP